MTPDTPLYDMSPLAWLLLAGALLALLPLAWIGLRHRHASSAERWHALTLLTLFLTFDLVLFGAFTRLSDSGLGCPDWPGCYGQASPLGAHAEISAAQTALPSGPVTHGKAWVEMVHRYLATSVGFLILVLTLASWAARWRAWRTAQAPSSTGTVSAAAVEPLSPWWPTLTLVWVCIQGAFGALTVTMKLFPLIVTLHLAGGLLLLLLLCVQAVRGSQALLQAAPLALPRGLRRGLGAVLLLLGVQVLLGGWVSTNYAVLVCAEFPGCQGSWWPAMDFAQGFELWRPLGLLQDGSYISLAGLTAIHYAHRLCAYVLFAAIAGLLWRWRQVPALRTQARWLGGLTLLQLASGLSNVVFDWPLLAALLHTGGAAALALVLSWALLASRSLCPAAFSDLSLAAAQAGQRANPSLEPLAPRPKISV